jgi:glutamyl-tRNA synthetase
MSWQDPNTGEHMQGFREKGYLPEALLNFLALLGWNPGNQQDIFSKEDLIRAFTIERIGKSGIKFDIHKAAWFNQQYLRAKPDETLVMYLIKALEENKIAYTPEKVLRVCQLIKERAVFTQDFWQQGKHFFVNPEVYDEKVLQTKWNSQVCAVLQDFVTTLETVEVFQADLIKAMLVRLLEARSIKTNQVMPVIRVALTGLETGPDLMQSMELIGREECIARISTFVAKHAPS